ncbi:MAG: PVC-type heme-binding CxxCH protein [Bryobacteraceae bacterium]
MRSLVAILSLLTLAACSRSGSGSKPLTPQQSMAAIKPGEDFHLELFASEPMVLDPVDMVFDEQGRAYVADMLDLPYDPPPGKKARSRIVMLEDTDGDGKADKSTVFAEDVLQVSGLMPWKGGLIVPAAPNIYYMKDTDGDGKADVREVLFTGFFTGNPEAQVSNPRLGPDNWIMFSNTGNAGRITSPKWPQHAPVEVRGGDFRFHPIRNIAQPASGATQYGATFDDWGNRFISQNTTHLRHVVIPMQYLLRSPLLDVASVNNDPYGKRERLMWPISQPEQWRVERTKIRQQRYDEMKSGRKEHLAGHLTGATGGTVYSGDAWPESYRGSIFTGDVSGNLVRRDVLTPDGVSFTATPAKEGVEFLASTDQWFRPTNFANAPDGMLYVTDMYRQTIETPLSIPEELQKRLKLDFYRGDDMGHIYRIVPNNPRTKRGLKVDLGKASTAELVGLLENANGWHRDTAHRLLLERQDKSAAAALRQLAQSTRNPVARMHALWLLEGIGSLEEADVLTALNDPQAGVREHAIRISESLPPSPKLEQALLARVKDEAIRVRFQLAFTLGNLNSAAARSAIVTLAANHGDNPWFHTATLSSAANWPGEYFAMLLARPESSWQRPELLRSIGGLIGTRKDPAEVTKFLAGAGRLKDPAPALQGLARGLDMSRATAMAVSESAVAQFLARKETTRLAWSVASHLAAPSIFTRAAKEAFEDARPVEDRAAALGALRGASFETAFPTLKKVLDSNAAAPLQSAAVDTLATFRQGEAATTILNAWKAYPPETRLRAAAALLAQRDRIPLFLEALEKGAIDPVLIEVNARNRLIEDKDAAISARAKKIFASTASDRDKVVTQFREVVSLNGDVERGKKAFEEACARCHAPRRKGGRVGPDLSGVNNKSKEELLEAILNPSRAIEPRFVNYVVTAKDGQMYDGVLASETPGAITLRGGSEEDVTILRSNIQEIRASAISLMPEDIEKTLNKQQLADVIAFLRAGL